MVDFVIAGLVLRDSILGVRRLLSRAGTARTFFA